jgi:hypothetical protein
VAGLEYARTHGTKSGRSLGRPRCVFDRDAVRTMCAEGQSWTRDRRSPRCGCRNGAPGLRAQADGPRTVRTRRRGRSGSLKHSHSFKHSRACSHGRSICGTPQFLTPSPAEFDPRNPLSSVRGFLWSLDVHPKPCPTGGCTASTQAKASRAPGIVR